MDFAKVDARQDTIIHFGNKDALAQMISFTDYREIDVMKGGGYIGAGGYLAKDYVPIKKWLQFNENGEVTHIAKNDEDWVPIVGDYKGKGVLGDIYRNSGKTVQEMIERANNGEGASYGEFRKKFYSDDSLKSNAGDIKIESYQKNFVNFNANNVDVGGTGKIEILRDISKLEGINADKFEIKAGDAVIEITGTDVKIPSLSKTGTYPKIDYIAGKVESSGEISVGTRKKIGLDSNGVFTTENSVVRSGDLISGDVGKGITANSYLSFESKDMEDIRSKVESVGASKQRDVMIDSSMQKQFSVNIDLFLPFAGLSAPGVPVGKYYNEVLKKKLTETISQSLTVPEVGELRLNEETKIMVDSIASNVVGKLTSQNLPLGGMYHFELVNNPNGNAQIIASIPSSDGKSMSRTVIEIQDAAQNKLFKDVFEGSLRVPDMDKGDMPGISSTYYQKTRYASQAYYDLWRENIGTSIANPLGINYAVHFAGSEFIRSKIRERTSWEKTVSWWIGLPNKEGMLDKYTSRKK